MQEATLAKLAGESINAGIGWTLKAPDHHDNVGAVDHERRVM
jgi:hypothetical protein